MTLDARHDLSAYVLSLLDEHLSAMQEVRDRMRHGSTTSPGGRREAALASASLAETYAASLRHALVTLSLLDQALLDGKAADSVRAWTI